MSQVATPILEETELREPGIEVLRRSLKIGSVISTASSFIDRVESLGQVPHIHQLRNIGEGLQGTIFEQGMRDLFELSETSVPPVLKKEKPGNAYLPCNLRDESLRHAAAYRAFENARTRPEIESGISIPYLRNFLTAEVVESRLPHRFPADCQAETDIVVMDRILPVPKAIRRALIEVLYPFSSATTEEEKSDIIEGVLNTDSNKDCLVRPYLGLPQKKYTQRDFSLRNIVLGLNTLRQLWSDIVLENLAGSLGRAYATLHWGANINGDDIEFVMGSSLPEVAENAVPDAPLLATMDDYAAPRYQQRKIGLFLIDFGQCDAVDLRRKSADEVYRAFRGALVIGDNACFIPKPRYTPGLFGIFKREYAAVAKQFVSEVPWKQAKFDVDEFMGLYEEYVEEFL